MPKETFINLSKEKQEKIMKAAINEFLKNGYEKGNIGEIAKNAGVAKGSMYQYFENKQGLFVYAVEWCTDILYNKYGVQIYTKEENTDIFDYMYQNAKNTWSHLVEDREVMIFLQDVFLGKYSNMPAESLNYMLKASNEFLLQQIRAGKESGYIRKDIDDQIIALYMTGVSFKLKENMMNKARAAGEDLVDESFEKAEQDIKDMVDLLKNGMHA